MTGSREFAVGDEVRYRVRDDRYDREGHIETGTVTAVSGPLVFINGTIRRTFDHVAHAASPEENCQ